MKKDIEDREDVKRLVDAFYEKMLKDEVLGHIFTTVVDIDLTAHLLHLYDFWESVLFQVGNYKRDVLEKHLELNHIHHLDESHFNLWLKYFNDTVDELFEGVNATGAKNRALSIAQIIKMKIDDLEKRRLEVNN